MEGPRHGLPKHTTAVIDTGGSHGRAQERGQCQRGAHAKLYILCEEKKRKKEVYLKLRGDDPDWQQAGRDGDRGREVSRAVMGPKLGIGVKSDKLEFTIWSRDR